MKINARFTRTFRETPLVSLEGGPFNGTEATPEQLIALANALTLIAQRAAKLPCQGKSFRPQSIKYEVA